jgi:hypothetical protein
MMPIVPLAIAAHPGERYDDAFVVKVCDVITVFLILNNQLFA